MSTPEGIEKHFPPEVMQALASTPSSMVVVLVEEFLEELVKGKVQMLQIPSHPFVKLLVFVPASVVREAYGKGKET